MSEVDDATIARDLDRRLREEESLGVTTMTTIKITRWMMAVNKDAEGHHGETRRTSAETGRLRIRSRSPDKRRGRGRRGNREYSE